MKECKCDMRTKLVGDGCETCNPEQALEYARDTIEELMKERDELAAQVEAMRAFIVKVSLQKPEKPDHWNSCGQCEYNENEADDLLSLTPSAALREVQARTLEEAANRINGLPIDMAMLRRMAADIRKGE